MRVVHLRDISRKLIVLNHAKNGGNVAQTCRYFGIFREIFYQWKRACERDAESALINSKPCPQNQKLRTPAEIEETILHLGRTYHPLRLWSRAAIQTRSR